jgi:hypothetical protein
VTPSLSLSGTPMPSPSPSSNRAATAPSTCSSAPVGFFSDVAIDVAGGVVHCQYTPTECVSPFWVEVVYETTTVLGTSASFPCTAGTAVPIDIAIQIDPLLQGSSTTVTVQASNTCGVGTTYVAEFVDQAISGGDAPPPPPATATTEVACSSAAKGVLTGFINVAMGTVHADVSSVSTCGAPMWIDVFYDDVLIGHSGSVTCTSSTDSFSFDINIQTDPLFQGSTTTVVMKLVNNCGSSTALTMGFTDMAVAPPPPPSSSIPMSSVRAPVPQGVVRAMSHTTSSSSQSGLTTGLVSIQYTGTVNTDSSLWVEVYYDSVVIGRSHTFLSPAIGETVSMNVDFHLLLGVVMSSELVVQAVSAGGAGSSIVIDCVGLGAPSRPDRHSDVFNA